MSDAATSWRVSPGLLKVAERAKRHPEVKMLALAHHIDEPALERAFRRLRRDAAVGVDGCTVDQYGERLAENLQTLRARMKAGQYRHQSIRRVNIPKENGTTRPIGVSTVEDKIVQGALRDVLEAIYEQDFLECSYGFRPGRSAHDAIRALQGAFDAGEANYIVEADIVSFFDSIDRKVLMEMLRDRIADETLMRLIGKCLHVGILDGERVLEPDEGTAQGSSLSPLLGNIYLHHVLDVWFHREVQPRLHGRSVLVRYADDRAPRRRGKEIARSNGSSLAAREMRAGPSGSGCRTWVQTTGCCFDPMIEVVSETEKAGPTRQVCAVKTNASEPSMTCRKRRDVHRNRAPVVGPGQARAKPADGSSGDRHEDGVSTAQALVRNVGTFSLDAKRELQAVDP
ncbi:MAG: reverse transcriptase domain-containing protein [Acidobacteriota bacterium]